MGKSVLRHKIKCRICTLRRCILRIWDRILMCSLGKPVYSMLSRPATASSALSSPLEPVESRLESGDLTPTCHHYQFYDNKDPDLVALKISLLGDCQIGKTSFLEKYVGNEKDHQGIMQENGMKLMGKTLIIGGARISYRLWEVDGNEGPRHHQVAVACKDSVAILIMFDLTSRITLNGVISWYQEARKWNQTAIPIIVGTKFDDFIQLPIDLQWAIASQARAYAKALNATLFFSSATYNINVNKIFKFITAKLFDLPWTVERNLNVGEPIIDF